jgi:hypothetical protein
VVALISTTAFTEEADITDAVFGRKALQFTQGEPESVVPVRLWNGYWHRACRFAAHVYQPSCLDSD